MAGGTAHVFAESVGQVRETTGKVASNAVGVALPLLVPKSKGIVEG